MSTRARALAGRSEAFALLVVTLSASCGAEQPSPSADLSVVHAGDPPPPAGRLEVPASIVLITVDTLRRDHLGCYGYFRDTSPNVDAFAAESVLFERVLAPMATTLPSHLSMLTGVYAHQHGRTSNGAGVRNPFVSSAGCLSVAQALGQAGYDTAAFVSSPVIGAHTGIGDGFDVFRAPGNKNTLLAEHTTDRALGWLERKRRGDRPFFLWIHYWDTHEPNTPPAPFAARFRGDARLAAWIRARGIDPAALMRSYADDEKTRSRYFSVDGAIEVQEVADLMNRYDGDLRYVDLNVGRVLTGLRELGLWERSIVVFTADHGQSLGEHTLLGHDSITDVNTFVPLIVRFPAGVIEQPLRVKSLVSLVDLFPTLVGRLDPGLLAAFRAQVEGQDVLSGSFTRPYALTQETIKLHRGREQILWCALHAGRWKYVFRSDADDLLFDMEGAGEGVDVMAANPHIAAELLETVEGLLRKTRPQVSGARPTPFEEEELLETLRQLGYGGER